LKDFIDIFRCLSKYLLVLHLYNPGTDGKRMFPNAPWLYESS